MFLGIETLGIFGSYFLKLLLRTIFENVKNIFMMLVVFENCSCFLNLVFSMFVFF